MFEASGDRRELTSASRGSSSRTPDAIDLAVWRATTSARSPTPWPPERPACLPQAAIEFQLLYGMADADRPGARRRSASASASTCRSASCLPGMAYLVRRLLENTSNESFLRRGFAENESPEALLADPAGSHLQPRSAARPPPDEARARRRAAGRPFHHVELPSPASRPARSTTPRSATSPAPRCANAWRRALDTVAGQLGRAYPLVIGGQPVDTPEAIISVDPSRADRVVGRVASASAGDVDHAVATAARALPTWRDRGVESRADILGRAAEELRRTAFRAGRLDGLRSRASPGARPTPTSRRRSTSASTTRARPAASRRPSVWATLPAR